MDRNLDVPDIVELLGDWAVGRGPLYRRLADALERIIRDGGIQPGESLPPERPFAKALAVSRATVVAAYDKLREQGIVDSRQGSGTRVSRLAAPLRQTGDGRVSGGRATSILQRMIDDSSELISLTRATDAAAPEVEHELIGLASDGIGELLHDPGYRPAGLPVLREAIAQHYRDLGVPTQDNQVMVTSGAQQALNLISAMLLRRNVAAVVESPSWPGCLDTFRAARARLLGVPLDEEGINAVVTAQALADHQPMLMFVMPTYHNPTGTLMSRRRRVRIAELAAQHGTILVEDNNFMPAPEPDGSPGPRPIAGYAGPDASVLTVGTLSKLVWSGLRVGWVRGPVPLIDKLARLKANADLGNPIVEQALAARLMPRLPALAARRYQEARERLTFVGELLRDRLPQWRWQMPDGGSALWVQVPHTDTRAFAQVALRHGVEIVPGAAVDSSGRHDDHIRVPCIFPYDVMDEMTHRLQLAWEEATGSTSSSKTEGSRAYRADAGKRLVG